MRASELVAYLQYQISIHGDQPVMLEADCNSTKIRYEATPAVPVFETLEDNSGYIAVRGKVVLSGRFEEQKTLI
jgi:hypothetical protein